MRTWLAAAVLLVAGSGGLAGQRLAFGADVGWYYPTTTISSSASSTSGAEFASTVVFQGVLEARLRGIWGISLGAFHGSPEWNGSYFGGSVSTAADGRVTGASLRVTATLPVRPRLTFVGSLGPALVWQKRRNIPVDNGEWFSFNSEGVVVGGSFRYRLGRVVLWDTGVHAFIYNSDYPDNPPYTSDRQVDLLLLTGLRMDLAQ